MSPHRRQLCLAASLALSAALTPTILWASDAQEKKNIVFIHTGDLHGDLKPHTNAREDANGLLEGGFARVAAVVKKLRRTRNHTVHVHTGDTLSGSAIATFTQGEGLVKAVDQLDIDVMTPGNWEFSYGIYRFLQFFGTGSDLRPYTDGELDQFPIKPIGEQGVIDTFGRPFVTDHQGERRRWGIIAANAYFNGENTGPGVVNKGAGELLTDPYLIKEVNGVRIGFIGCTTNRGPQVVSSKITNGVSFSNCMGEVKFPQNRAVQWPQNHPNKGFEPVETAYPGTLPHAGGDKGFRTVPEVVKFTQILRAAKGQPVPGIPGDYLGEGVDLVILLSEAGIAENIWNAENTDMPAGVRFPEIIFSSDMHEETKFPVVVTNKAESQTIIIEQGEDGAQVGELKIKVENGEVGKWKWTAHSIDERVPEHPRIASLVNDIHLPFHGDNFEPGKYVNPFNGAALTQPLETVIGQTEIILERNRFSHERDEASLIMPAIIEGTGHDVIVDAFRVMTGADVGGIRGFRYTNTILPGPVTLDDMYHYLSVGAMVAVGNIPAAPENESYSGDDSKTDHTVNKRHFMAWPRNLIQEIELSGNSTMNTNVPAWGGGWIWSYSGIDYDFDPYHPNFDRFGSMERARIANARLLPNVDTDNPKTGAKQLGSDVTSVSYASYYFDVDFNRINRNQLVTSGSCEKNGFPGLTRACVGNKIKILVKDGPSADAGLLLVTPQEYADNKGVHTFPLDAVEVVARYVNGTHIVVKNLAGDIVHTAQGLGGVIRAQQFAKTFPRVHLTEDLPNGFDEFGFGVIEPLRGALRPQDQTQFAAPPSDRGRLNNVSNSCPPSTTL